MLGRAQIQCPTVQVCLYACNVCRSLSQCYLINCIVPGTIDGNIPAYTLRTTPETESYQETTLQKILGVVNASCAVLFVFNVPGHAYSQCL